MGGGRTMGKRARLSNMTAGMARTAERNNVKHVGIIVAIMMMIFSRPLATIKARQVFWRRYFAPQDSCINYGRCGHYDLIFLFSLTFLAVFSCPFAGIVTMILLFPTIWVFGTIAQAGIAALFALVEAANRRLAFIAIVPAGIYLLSRIRCAVLALIFCLARLTLPTILVTALAKCRQRLRLSARLAIWIFAYPNIFHRYAPPVVGRVTCYHRIGALSNICCPMTAQEIGG